MSGTHVETNLEQYPSSWRLAARGPVMKQEDGLLIPVDTAFGPAMLKQALEGQTLTTSSSLLRWYRGSGSANIIRKRKNAQLLELIDGPALSDLVNDKKDDLANEALAEVIKKLHAPKPSRLKARLTPLSTTMRPVIEQKFSENLIHRHASRLIRHLLQTTEKQTPLHGDLHFDKVMHHSKRGWLTIAPQGVLGDPHYEPASALCHPNGQPDLRHVRERIQSRASRVADKLSLNKDRLLTFAFCHACLKHIYAERDGGDVNHWHDMSVILLDSLVE